MPTKMPEPSSNSQAPIVPPRAMLASKQKIQIAKLRTTAIRPPLGGVAAQTQAKGVVKCEPPSLRPQATQPLGRRAEKGTAINQDRKSTRLNSSHLPTSYPLLCF